LQWLCPPYWTVESYLHSFRHQRANGTLKWARDMPAFRDWRLSGLEKESPNRVTWINGTLGVGKSIMAAYFIDLLKCQYPNAIVAYFFCRSKEAGVFTARDILRALAYQCMEKVGAAGEALKELKSQGFQISDNLGIGYLFEMLLPSTFNKPIQKEDTEADIDTYVMDTVHSSSTLQMLFQATCKDALQYFREKGCGIFLWVVLVLQQLERARTKSTFLKYLDGFSAATGSMEDLYFAILSKVEEEDKPWVLDTSLGHLRKPSTRRRPARHCANLLGRKICGPLRKVSRNGMWLVCLVKVEWA